MKKNTEWKKIFIQANNIEAETARAVLIKMPQKSKYKGFTFWHPISLVRSQGKNNYLLQISFTDEFKFKLKKYGKGQYNYNQVLDEKELSSTELMSEFGFGVDETLLEELADD